VVLHILGTSEETPDAQWDSLILGGGAEPKIFTLGCLTQIGLREERSTFGVEASYQLGILEDPGIVLHRSEARRLKISVHYTSKDVERKGAGPDAEGAERHSQLIVGAHIQVSAPRLNHTAQATPWRKELVETQLAVRG
jgi:hypothetical protein